jgi:hypothetical protein
MGDWKKEMREELARLTGGKVKPVEVPSIPERVVELVQVPAIGTGMVQVVEREVGAKLYDLEGQDFSVFRVGGLVELVPTVGNRNMYPYLPTTRKVGPNQRHEMFKLEGIRKGLVVRKGWRDTREVFEASRSNENNLQADLEMRRIEKEGVRHGRAEYMEVLLGEDEVVVEVLAPSCDSKRSFLVRSIELPPMGE